MGRKNGDVWAARDTFWNKVRVESGYTQSEIADTIDVGVKSVGAYFTGYVMPSDETIKKFCDLFGVDFMKGKGEFCKAYQEYSKTHNRKCLMRKPMAEPVVEKVEKPTVETPKKVNYGDKVLEMLYGKIPYVDFKILTGQLMSGANILECVYGKVDFETFAKITKTITT